MAQVTKICIIINFIRTCVGDQPRFLRMWSCSGNLIFSKIFILKNRSRKTFKSPIPPFTKIIELVARIRNGFPLTITQTPIKNPRARLPASPIKHRLGNALSHKYPITTPAIAKSIIAQLAPAGMCGSNRYAEISL